MAAGGITPIPLSDLKNLPQSYQLWYLRIKDLLDQSITDTVPWSQIDTAGSNLTDITTRTHASLQSIAGSSDGVHVSTAEGATLTAIQAGTANTITWATVSKSGSNLTDLATRNHSGLQNIDGGTYHLSQSQYETINTLSTKTADYTATSTDGIILVDATSGVVTITLPAASARKELHIKKIDASANAVTIGRAGADTIEGSTSKSLAAQYNSYTIYSDGSTTWYIKAST